MSDNVTDTSASSFSPIVESTLSSEITEPGSTPPPPAPIASDAPAPPPSETSVIIVTSVVTENPASTGGTEAPSVIVVTSTSSPDIPPTTALSTSLASAEASSSSSSGAAALATSGAGDDGTTGGLPQGGKIAVAVVVPIVAIALIVVGVLFFWKKRKARKSAEEQRKNEMEEYRFNPNNDPTLPPVGMAYGEGKGEEAEDGVGYRGWGTTNSATARRPSTNLDSGQGGVGIATSDPESVAGGYGYATSPSNGTDRPSEGHSGDPLIGSPSARPTTADSDLPALGGAPIAGAARQDRGVHRGTSNASSAYSNGGARSEGSDDIPLPGGAPSGRYYHEDSPYYNDGPMQPGVYGDLSYGGGQPVIRDVQARRNTRIEKPSIFPPQGNSGIAQNF